MGQSVFHPDSAQQITQVGEFPSAIGLNSLQLAATGAVMQCGIVKRYFEDIRMGTIRSPEGDSYAFRRRDWMSSGEPKTGLKVCFEVEKNKPIKIRVEE